MESDEVDTVAGDGNPAAGHEKKKEEQVLAREGLETELMDHDDSEVGEQITAVEESPPE